MYIDLLDSAKSGHPFQSGNKEDWWRANTAEEQRQVVSIAQAAMMMRLLYGETLILSHNQIFDSVAWLSACKTFTDSAKIIPFTPITWAAYGDTLSPDGFIERAISIFRPAGKASFRLSAWPSLDDGEREIITKNLKTYGTFDKMLSGIRPDSSLKDSYQQQQLALKEFHKYLLLRYNPNVVWTPQIPTAIKICNRDNPRSIWAMLNTVRDHPLGIPSEVLADMQAQIAQIDKDKPLTEKLESRSLLYTSIACLDANLRGHVRKLIDFCYNLKTGQSAGPDCLYSVLDQNPDTPPSADSELLDFIEKEYFGEDQANDLINFHLGEFPELSTLRFDDCINILNEPQVQTSLLAIQNCTLEYPGQEAGFYEKLSWQMQMSDLTSKHNQLLAENLKGKVQIKDGILVALISATPIGLPILGDVVSYAMGNVPGLLLSMALTILGVSAIPKLMNNVNPVKIPGSAALGIYRRLQSSVQPKRASK